jgi:protease-4
MLRLPLVLIRNLLILPVLLVRWVAARLSKPPEVISLRLSGAPAYRAPAWSGWLGGAGPSIEDLTSALEAAAAEPRVKALVVRPGPLTCGWARSEALRQLILRFRASGKRTIAQLVEPGHKELLVASACAEVWLHDASPVLLTGLSAEVTFLAGGLDKLALRPQFERVGAYKGAVEPFTRSGPSEEYREWMDSVLRSLQGDLEGAIAEGRAWDQDRARATVVGGPYTSEELLETGLVDALCPPDELGERLGDGEEEARIAGPGRFLPGPRLLPIARPPVISVIPLHGLIRTAQPAGRSLVQTPAAEDIARLIRRAGKDKNVRAIILHIESRGGSATGSDLIWHAVKKAREGTPVIAWMGEIAASGGYYAASAADEIVAAPGTLTGSIGVVAGKLVVSGLLERLGLHREIFAAGPRAGAFSSARDFSEDELAWLRREIESVYERFLERICVGRGMSREAVAAVAEGRVWTGRQARERGLVDRLGSWPEALDLARSKAGIHPSQTATIRSPRATPYGSPRALLRPSAPSASQVAASLAGLAGTPPAVLLELLELASAPSPRALTWAPFLSVT